MNDEIMLEHVSTIDQNVDLLTKTLSPTRFFL